MIKSGKTKNFFLLFLLCSGLFLAIGIFEINPAQVQNQNTYHIALEGSTWNRTILRILLTTPNHASWWNPSYLNDTLRAIGQWNEAIQYFASNFTGYAFLSIVKFEPSVSSQIQPGFNIYLNWTENELGNTEDIGGLTTTTEQGNVVINCSINLATHSQVGIPFFDSDMQNIALHELGHTLGILCTNNTGEIMTPLYSPPSSAKLISTMDVYGVASAFSWITSFNSFYPVNKWLPSQPVILPSNIPYEFLPVSHQNAQPQTLANNSYAENIVFWVEFLTYTGILPILILVISILIFVALYPKKKKKKVRLTP